MTRAAISRLFNRGSLKYFQVVRNTPRAAPGSYCGLNDTLMTNSPMNDTPMTDSDRWKTAWSRLGLDPPPALFGELTERYGEPHRAYHTMAHLGECLNHLDEAAHGAGDSVPDPGDASALIEMALWFHDAIYDTKRSDNEEKSADWAHDALIEAGASAAVAGEVRDLVLATKHDAVPEGLADADAAILLVDIDLSILGAPQARFDEYEDQIRREYAWVPEEDFRAGRTPILQSFLARPRIFQTPHFNTMLESRARENMERSLARLGGG